jgi:hypothetical protein
MSTSSTPGASRDAASEMGRMPVELALLLDAGDGLRGGEDGGVGVALLPRGEAQVMEGVGGDERADLAVALELGEGLFPGARGRAEHDQALGAADGEGVGHGLGGEGVRIGEER